MEVEVSTGTGATTVKTYWPNGVGVEIDKAGASSSDQEWTYEDRLGSIIAISGPTGTLTENLEYDAWGKRRTLIGDATPDTLTGQTDNKGYTGHEMLDQLELVHMNGRVYDPLVARFMSADPLIQDPMHSQSYNRYTYVWNNPTNLTDPTGFETGTNLCSGSHSSGGCGFDAGSAGLGAEAQGNLSELAKKIGGIDKANAAVAQYAEANSGKKTPNNDRAYDSKKPAANNANSIKLFHYDGDWSPANEITSENRFINGMNNTEQQAKDISLVEMRKMKITEFDLVHIPTLGFANDLVRATEDKLGATTQTSKELAGLIKKAGPGNWFAHSYGGVAFTEAVRVLGKENVPRGQSITFLAGANNHWVTNRIMLNAGVKVRGYHNSWFDPVPNVAGFNSINPIQWIVDINALPFLATRWSPHTHPPVE